MFSKKGEPKKINSVRRLGLGTFFWLVLLIFVLTPPAVSGPERYDLEEEISFDEAHIFFELNNTDGDLGIHALIDGDPWQRLEIEDPNERRLLAVRVKGRLQRQGLTEFFFESAEPGFDELAPEKFFRRFPEGTYEIEGITLAGEEMESEVELSHVMPAPAEVYFETSEGRVMAAESCDADELPEFDEEEPVFISWDPVTESHPELGEAGDIVANNYEVVIEIDDTPWKTSTILPPSEERMYFQVPMEILDLLAFDEDGEAEVKFEVLVRAENYNQTAVESCFVVVSED